MIDTIGKRGPDLLKFNIEEYNTEDDIFTLAKRNGNSLTFSSVLHLRGEHATQ